MTTQSKNYLFSIDSHFHIYKQFQPDYLLNTVFRQLSSISSVDADGLEIFPILFLADNVSSDGFDFFNQYTETANEGNDTSWFRDKDHQDENSILLTKGSLERILIVRGYQLISRENLEILVIGQKIDAASFNQQPIHDIIQALKDDCLLILPWAVGKWLGKRGQVINTLMNQFAASDFCLGDNGGRPWIWKKIPQFDLARKKGFFILPGSDPLPLIGEEKKAGSYGFAIKTDKSAELSGEAVIRQVKSNLKNKLEFGQLETVFGFLKNQFMLRQKK